MRRSLTDANGVEIINTVQYVAQTGEVVHRLPDGSCESKMYKPPLTFAFVKGTIVDEPKTAPVKVKPKEKAT